MKKKIVVEFFCKKDQHPIVKKMLEIKNEQAFGSINKMLSSVFNSNDMPLPKFVMEDESPLSLVTMSFDINYNDEKDPLVLLFDILSHATTIMKEDFKLDMLFYEIKSIENIVDVHMHYD